LIRTTLFEKKIKIYFPPIFSATLIPSIADEVIPPA